MPTQATSKKQRNCAEPLPAADSAALAEARLPQPKQLIRMLKILDSENRTLRSSLELREKRYKKVKKIMLVASVPWLILLAPLTCIWLSGKLVKKIRKRRQSSANECDKDQKQDGSRVLRAFWWLQSLGFERAIIELDEDPASTPPGTKALFEAYEATDDTVWAEATNRWLAHQSKCQLEVVPGDAPRFKRLVFSEIAPVEAGPKVSVIMPAFNAEQWIELSVNSILNQSWRNLELIVVNDMSSDRTGEILNELAKTDSRLRVLHNTVNVGPYVSKNIALSFADGEFVTGHDADDIALPDRLHRQVDHLSGDTQCAAVIGHMIRVDESGVLSVATKVSEMSFDGIHRMAMISLMVRRDVIDAIGYWDCVRFGADSEFRARLNAHLGRRLKTVPDLTMICLSAPESLTNDPDFGLLVTGGMSPVRVQYRDNWIAWHDANKSSSFHRKFSNEDRPFSAPSEMLVPQKDIETLQTHYGLLVNA